ncbi:MAG: hypothetical protein AAB426_13600 [Myxococcota bacterium]
MDRYFVIQPRHLDLNGDGKVDTADAIAADRVARAAERVLRRTPVVGTPAPDPVAIDSVERATRDEQRWLRLGQFAKSPTPETEIKAIERPQVEKVAQLGAFAQRLIVATQRVAPMDAREGPPTPDEVEFVSFAPLVREGIQPVFLTDLDNTAWKTESGDRFVQMMLREQRVRPEATTQLVRLIWALHERHPQVVGDALGIDASTEDAIQAKVTATPPSILARLVLEDLSQALTPYELFLGAVALTAGYTRRELDSLGRRLFTEPGPNGESPLGKLVYPDQVDTYRRLRAKGAVGRAVSAGMDFIAKAGAKRLGFKGSEVDATTLVYDENGRSTGAYAQRNYASKDDVALRLMRDLKGLVIAVYGDSKSSDTPMAIYADAVDRALDPAGDLVQNALRPELKAHSDAALPALEKWVDELNQANGTHLEAHPTPKTLEEGK